MEQKEERSEFDGMASELVQKIGISGGMKNLALIIYFLMKEIIMVRWLGTKGAISYSYFNGLLAVFTAFILITSNVLPKFYQEHGKAGRQLYNRAVSWIIIINFLIVEGAFWGVSFIDPAINITTLPLGIYLLMLGLAAVFPLIFTIIQSGLYGFKAAKNIGLSYALQVGCFSILLIILHFTGLLSFVTAMWIYIIANVVSTVYAILLLRKNIHTLSEEEPLSLRSNEGKAVIKRILVFVVPLFFSNIFYFLNYRLGNIFLRVINPNYVLYYNSSTNIIIMFIALIGLPINDMAYPYITTAFNKNDTTQLKQIINFIFPIINLLLTGGLIVIYCLAPFIIGFLFPKYVSPDFIELFKLFALGGIFYCLNQFLARIPIAKGRTKVVLIAQSIAGILNVILLYFAVVYQNLKIAGLGFIFSSVAMTIIYLYDVLRISSLKLTEMKILQMFFVVTVSILVFEGLQLYTHYFLFPTLICILIFIGLNLILKITPLKSIKFIAKALFSLLKSLIVKKKEVIKN